MRPEALDAGALIVLEKRNRRMLALLEALVHGRSAAHVPAGVLAQVWRGTSKQHPIARLVKTRAARVHPLTERLAYSVGSLLAASKTTDVVDAHVALLARSLGASVITSDPNDLARLDPRLRSIEI